MKHNYFYKVSGNLGVILFYISMRLQKLPGMVCQMDIAKGS